MEKKHGQIIRVRNTSATRETGMFFSMHPELAGSDKRRWENMPTGMCDTGATPLQHIRKWQLIQCHSEKEVHQMLQCFSFCGLSWESSEAQMSVFVLLWS